MVHHTHKVVGSRRKAQGKTNYRKRLKLLISEKARAVIRKSQSQLQMQIVAYDPKGDIILAKGSQGVRIERIVKEIMAEPERAAELLVRQDASWR